MHYHVEGSNADGPYFRLGFSDFKEAHAALTGIDNVLMMLGYVEQRPMIDSTVTYANPNEAGLVGAVEITASRVDDLVPCGTCRVA